MSVVVAFADSKPCRNFSNQHSLFFSPFSNLRSTDCRVTNICQLRYTSSFRLLFSSVMLIVARLWTIYYIGGSNYRLVCFFLSPSCHVFLYVKITSRAAFNSLDIKITDINVCTFWLQGQCVTIRKRFYALRLT